MKFANLGPQGVVALFVLASWLFPGSGETQIQTIITDHFRIHYMSGASGTARRVADISEEVFASLAAAYNYYDEFNLVHVIVVDSSDMLGNGSAKASKFDVGIFNVYILANSVSLGRSTFILVEFSQ